MIHFDNVSKRYAGGHEALNGLSFGVAAGEMVFVTGHSGAGKTTLLKLLGLIERPTRGEIVVNGAALARVRQRAIPQVRRGIGMVFQNHRLLMDRSVFDNVALPLTIAVVGKPPLIIADEPPGNLDPQLSVEIMHLFAEFQQVGTTVLIASHDLHLIRHMGKRVLVLDHGQLIDDFRPQAS